MAAVVRVVAGLEVHDASAERSSFRLRARRRKQQQAQAADKPQRLERMCKMRGGVAWRQCGSRRHQGLVGGDTGPEACRRVAGALTSVQDSPAHTRVQDRARCVQDGARCRGLWRGLGVRCRRAHLRSCFLGVRRVVSDSSGQRRAQWRAVPPLRRALKGVVSWAKLGDERCVNPL